MKEIFSEIKQTVKESHPLVLLFTLSMSTRAIGFLHIPIAVSYVLMFLMAFYVFSKQNKIENHILFMLLYFVLNVLICDPPSVFQPWLRLGFFILLIVCVGPLIQGSVIREYRSQSLHLMLWIISFLSVGTFFCRFLGINFMFHDDNIEAGVGLFGGLFNHSMTMGPAAGISAVFMAYKAFYAESNQKKIYIAACIMSLGSVFFSASRSALLCAFIGVLVMLMKASSTKEFSKIIVASTLVGVLTFPLWGSVTNDVVAKNEANIEAGGMANSRESKWNARMLEFKSSPLIGIGFSSIDSRYDVVGFGGIVEPGTSWLAVLSMTGIVGFLIFISIFYKAFESCNRKKNSEDELYIGLLALFATHLIAEGYVFAAGGFLCFMFWLVLGCCYDRKYCQV